MNNSDFKNLRKTIMPKLLHGLSNNDKKQLVNFLRMQANYVYFDKGYGSKKPKANDYASAAYQYMTNDYKNMSQNSQNKIKSLNLKSITPSQKNNWGILASGYAKSHPELFRKPSVTNSQSTHLDSSSQDVNQKKADFAWKNIMSIAHKQSKQYKYYQKNGFPFNYLINSVSQKDKIPFAHAIMDKSRIDYAKRKGYKAYKYQKDFKRNSGYLTPQGLNKFNSLLKTESPKHFNSLGFASANYIKKYNQAHPHNFNINQTLAKLPQDDRLHTAQYLNDMSKGLYFGLHGNVKLGNSLIDNGHNAKDQLNEDSAKLAHSIIQKGIKHHTLSNIGFQAHKYVNHQYQQFKVHRQQYSHSSGVNVHAKEKKSLSHVNLASKLFGDNKNKKPKTDHHFSGKNNKPSLHPKKQQKKTHQLSPKEKQNREKMFSDLNQHSQSQQ